MKNHKNMLVNFKTRLLLSSIATIPILILSPMIQSIFAFSLVIPGNIIILSGLSTLVYGYGGWPFIKGCITELREKKLGMMTLITLAITVAHGYSILVAFKIIAGKFFFWEVATLIDVMLLGHWIEMKTTMKAGRSLEMLARLLPSMVTIVMPDGSTKKIKHAKLKIGDLVAIEPGEKIPSDGIVTEGTSEINQAMLTGESKLIPKKKGDAVIGGSINQNGVLVIKVSKLGEKSYLQKVIKLVKSAIASKSRAQTIANKSAFFLTVISIASGIGTLTWWLANNFPIHFALERMVSVMVIACPHALGLAIPLVVIKITTLATQNGFLIKNRTAFESAHKCDCIVFDKTGTLTTGEFEVTKIISLKGTTFHEGITFHERWTKEKIIKYAAAIEQKSEHSIAKSIIQYAKEKNIPIPKITHFSSEPGVGATGVIRTKKIFVGSHNAIEKSTLSPSDKKIIDKITSENNTFVIVAQKTTSTNASPLIPTGIIVLSDTIRKEAKKTCAQLKSLKIEPYMITGDNKKIAKNVATKLGIKSTNVFANVLPEKKAAMIKKLQKKVSPPKKTVIMVGDGVNDAPALAQADVGIAIGSGTDIAAETADIILIKNNLTDVVNILKISKLMKRKMIQNLAWATGYNIIAIPLAAGILYNYGILVPPAVGALVMSVSTVIVAVNSQLIKK